MDTLQDWPLLHFYVSLSLPVPLSSLFNSLDIAANLITLNTNDCIVSRLTREYISMIYNSQLWRYSQ